MFVAQLEYLMTGLHLQAANDNPARLSPSRSAELIYRLALEADRTGRKRDVMAAYKCLTLASIGGCHDARQYRRKLIVRMTLDEISESHRELCEWCERVSG